ncbi:hypothetical protein C8J56DRAFT_1173573 [Mycena floridula]|nr:hypothetical protein C8J56DRAFT_1173573 [Mycena floridula]
MVSHPRITKADPYQPFALTDMFKRLQASISRCLFNNHVPLCVEYHRLVHAITSPYFNSYYWDNIAISTHPFLRDMETNILGATVGSIEGGFLSNNRVSVRIVPERPSAESISSSLATADVEAAAEDDFSFWRSSTVSSQLVVELGYRIHAAIHKGKVRAVKIYEGVDSRERVQDDMDLNHCLSHSTILRTIAGCKTAPRPFVILDTGIGHSSSTDLGSLKTLSCYLTHALTGFERDCFLAGAKLMRDFSAGLDHIESVQSEQRFSLSKLTFDLIVDAENNICISVGVRKNEFWTERRSHDVDGYFDIFQRQCSKEFNSANFEQNGAGLPDTYDDVPRAKSHLDVEELPFTCPSDIPISPRPRREYVFIPERTSISLRQMSEKYNSLIRLLSDETVSIYRWCRNAPFTTPNTVAHRCPGYRRQEVTIGTLVTRSALILHFTPSMQERCTICYQLVQEGTFSCSCEQADDGVSPTIQCCKCLVWSHRECKTRLANDSSSQGFTCSVCRKHRSLWSGLSTRRR